MESLQTGDGKVEMVPRAQRFPIQVALRYRVRGERDWRDGTVQNISVSGLLFKGERLVDPHTPIEMSFVLPGSPAGERSARVVGKGIVVRSPATPCAIGSAMMAAALAHSRLVRR
jgi:hypothetical protein